MRLHTPSRHLRSSACNRLQQHRVKLALAERAFCHAASAVWNSLSQSITSDISCFTSFKRLLKTEYFHRVNDMCFYPHLRFFTIVNDLTSVINHVTITITIALFNLHTSQSLYRSACGKLPVAFHGAGHILELLHITHVLAYHFTQYYFMCVCLVAACVLQNYCISHVKCMVSAKRTFIAALLSSSRCFVK